MINRNRYFIGPNYAVGDRQVNNKVTRIELIDHRSNAPDVGRVFIASDGGFTFQFFRSSRDDERGPVVMPSGIVKAGREWMRKNMPEQWAAFCAMYLNGDRNDFAVRATVTGRTQDRIPWVQDHGLIELRRPSIDAGLVAEGVVQEIQPHE